MRIFVYEHLTAHGIGRDPSDPMHGMYREGRAMRDAVAADFRRIPGFEVELSQDHSTDGGFRAAVARSARQVVIAPETDGILLDLLTVAEREGSPIGCSLKCVKLTADKLALAEHWRDHGVRTPATSSRLPTACELFPVVWKPRYGAGSMSTFRLCDRFDVAQARAIAGEQPGDQMVVQEYVPGRAASLGFLCGPEGNFPLRPASQMLSDDGRFRYCGGVLPLAPHCADRALQLATRATACVPGLMGFVGVDVVLGDEHDCSSDYVIEINPRLTTSYIGLRALAKFNVAEMMLQIADGGRPLEFSWRQCQITFGADGSITTRSRSATR